MPAIPDRCRSRECDAVDLILAAEKSAIINRMSASYRDFVSEFERLLADGASLPRGRPCGKAATPAKPGAPTVLVLAPHPDDECLVGVLPRRLQREQGWRVAVAAVTWGSRQDRRAARRAELAGACGYLGWDMLDADAGLTQVVRDAAPRLILFPHADDANSTHRDAHRRALAALGEAGAGYQGFVAETEYWSTLRDPNLMVAASADAVADLAAALSFHEGEIARSPYHILLPCWLADGARRGAELVGGQGAGAASGRFAALYRLSRWDGRALARVSGPGRIASVGADVAVLLAP